MSKSRFVFGGEASVPKSRFKWEWQHATACAYAPVAAPRVVEKKKSRISRVILLAT